MARQGVGGAKQGEGNEGVWGVGWCCQPAGGREEREEGIMSVAGGGADLVEPRGTFGGPREGVFVCVFVLISCVFI